jgi:hypothetical protein
MLCPLVRLGSDACAIGTGTDRLIERALTDWTKPPVAVLLTGWGGTPPEV